MKNDEAIQRLIIDKQVAIESDAFYEQATRLGMAAAKASMKNSPINNLKNIVFTANRSADIYDFIKTNIGRADRGIKEFWEPLLVQIQALETVATKINKTAGCDDKSDHDIWFRKIHIILCREFVKHLYAQYLYSSGNHKG